MLVPPAIELSSEVRLELEMLSRRRIPPVRVVQRTAFVPLAADGMQNKQIAGQHGASHEPALAETVFSVRRRRADEGCSPSRVGAEDPARYRRRNLCPDDTIEPGGSDALAARLDGARDGCFRPQRGPHQARYPICCLILATPAAG